MLRHFDLRVPISFIAAVQDAAGMPELARKLQTDDFTISEVSDALSGHPNLQAEFAGFAYDWQTDNNFPGGDEVPEYYPD